MTLLSFGAVSSTCGAVTAYPLALVRTRLQADGRPRWSSSQKALVPGEQHFKGALDCAAQILARDGVKGFYAGLVPNMLKVVPAVSISYAVYETISSSM
jgi:solute carrier family 25 phosphate transporter 23/24/25/41